MENYLIYVSYLMNGVALDPEEYAIGNEMPCFPVGSILQKIVTIEGTVATGCENEFCGRYALRTYPTQNINSMISVGTELQHTGLLDLEDCSENQLIYAIQFDNPGTYRTGDYAIFCPVEGSEITQFGADFHIAICPGNVNFQQTECLKVTVLVDEEDASYEVKNTSGEIIMAGVTTGDTLVLEFEAEGVYFIRVYKEDMGGPAEGEVWEITTVAIVFCNLINCLHKLSLEYLCFEDDPCCKECNEEDKALRENKAYHVQKLSTLLNLFIMLSDSYYSAYGWYYNTAEEALCDLKRIDDLIVEIRLLSKKCGIDECAKPPVSVNPCKTC